MTISQTDSMIRARQHLMDNLPTLDRSDDAAEGGCGVLGLVANVPIAGKHTLTAAAQMHNRGNGKGGGIAMVGMDPVQMGVDADTLRTHYLLQIALLDPTSRAEVEAQFITPHFDIAHAYELGHVADYTEIPELEVRPPDVVRYFVRVKPAVLANFAQERGLTELAPRALEDEFVYQNSFQLNVAFYASLGEQRAFVLSHGRDLIVLKIVGYAEQVVAYYQLEETVAKVWIAHQRYPTKGRVWHPGGAHPFIGLNEALVHNGDFANHHAVGEYLRQRNIGQLFLTDTEVSVQLFDLWHRVYNYPMEVILEAMAPTTEHDFTQLPAEKQALYRAIQATHLHASPDGPWFFILARSQADEGGVELLGITDTSMLRPQVFALYENDGVQMGLIASERQAISACLRSLSAVDGRFQPEADKYWAARGGSYTDGGSFSFAVSADGQLTCTNKFNGSVTLAADRHHVKRDELKPAATSDAFQENWRRQALRAYDNGGAPSLWRKIAPELPQLSWNEVAWGAQWLNQFATSGDKEWQFALATLSLWRDRIVNTGTKKRASLLVLVDESIRALLATVPSLTADTPVPGMRLINWETRTTLRAPLAHETGLILDAVTFPPEGDDCAANLLVDAFQAGWRHLIAYNWRGGRFAGSGFGPKSSGRLDLYGDVGDYTASGMDGLDIHIHNTAQDQIGQVLRRGKLVIHGDVGQTFMYGAKGGEVYVRGSAAGRPLINAVGRPRVVINGTCLDYLAESFMAGDPHNGGGFVIVNGMTYDEEGQLQSLESPYPGGNLFSLASGGAIFLRDPHHKVSKEQLNGGHFTPLSDADWALITPYLEENERLFDIKVADLLTVDGEARAATAVYRKVVVTPKETAGAETENR